MNTFFVFNGGKTHFLLILSPVLSLMRPSNSFIFKDSSFLHLFAIFRSPFCPYLNILLFGQQQGEVPTLVCVPFMKHHVQMSASVPQVYHCCSNGISTDLFLLLACCKLFHELQRKLILYMYFLTHSSTYYPCYLKEMGQVLRSTAAGTKVCAEPWSHPGRPGSSLPWWRWLENSLPLPCGSWVTAGSEMYERAGEN